MNWQVEHARKLAATIGWGFVWRAQPEGSEYWQKLCRRLSVIGWDNNTAWMNNEHLTLWNMDSGTVPLDVWNQLADLVMTGCVWDQQPEGADYWCNLHSRFWARAEERAPKTVRGDIAVAPTPKRAKKRMSYDAMARFLTKRGYYAIGSGAYSTVFAHDNDPDYVIKVSRSYDDWPTYVEWAQKEGFAGTLAPKVTHLKVYDTFDGRKMYVAKVERLAEIIRDVDNRELKDRYATLRRLMESNGKTGVYIGTAPKELKEQLRKVAEDYFTAKHGELYRFSKEFAKRFNGCGLDLHGANFMVDAGHTRLVCTDPLTDNGFSKGADPVRIRSTEPVFARAA